MYVVLLVAYCKATKSICYNSFFMKSRLSLRQWMIVMVWWAKEYPVLKAAREADTSDNTACQIYQWLREVCSTRLLQSQLLCRLTSLNFGTRQRYVCIYVYKYIHCNLLKRNFELLFSSAPEDLVKTCGYLPL